MTGHTKVGTFAIYNFRYFFFLYPLFNGNKGAGLRLQEANFVVCLWKERKKNSIMTLWTCPIHGACGVF